MPLCGESVTLKTLPPLPRGDHRLGRDRVGHQPGALDVEPDDRPEALWRDRLRGRQELAAGVVDEQIDLAVALEHPIDQRIDLLLLADVAYAGLDQSARTERHGFEQRLLATTTYDYPRTAASQLQRHLASKAAAAAADDRYLALQQRGREQTRALLDRAARVMGPLALGLPRSPPYRLADLAHGEGA